MNPELRRLLLGVLGGVLGLFLLITLVDAAYVLDETEQAVVLQFGRPVGDPVTTAGMHFKSPFVQEVRVFEKRILAWDGNPNQIPTRGREFISVDTTARWKIVDALQFLKSMRDQSGAQSRLDDIIDSVVRDKVSSTDLVEIVRSEDWHVTPEDLETLGREPTEDVQLTAKVVLGRGLLERSILAEAQKLMPSYGIQLVDVRIKRINYIAEVREQVFDRMISERQRIAERFRSEGNGEASRISGETQRLLAEVESAAKRDAEVIRGEADAEATRIYNDAYSADPEFYSFLRTLQSYESSLGSGTVLMLGADTDYLRYLRDGAQPPSDR